MKEHSEEKNTPNYRINKDIIHQKLGDDMIIVNLKTDQIYSLNPTGARFFELLTGNFTLSEIKEKLMEEFRVDSELLDSETQNIINNLLNESLIYADTE